MDVTVREYADLSESDVDLSGSAPVIRGAVLLGSISKNSGPGYKRRVYLAEAMKAAVPQYEGARGYYNHATPSDEEERGGNRDVRDFAGVWRDVRFDPNETKLRGDFHVVNDSAGKRLAWIASNFPTNSFGFSHDAAIVGDVDSAAESLNISEIRAVRSVDVVDRPATTQNFYESVTSEASASTTNPEEEGEQVAEKTEATEARVKAEGERDAAVADAAAAREELAELKEAHEKDQEKLAVAETAVIVERLAESARPSVAARIREEFSGKVATEEEITASVEKLEAFAAEVASESEGTPAPGARRIDSEGVAKEENNSEITRDLSNEIFGAMCGIELNEDK